MSDSGATRLPAWIFDVDDEDDVEMHDRTLLQELDIDPARIAATARWAVVAPAMRLLGRRIVERHPLLTIGSLPDQGKKNIDFWGPCGIVSLYIAILRLADVKHVPWVYMIWSLAAVFNHLVTRTVLAGASSVSLHLSVLGYSVCPIVIFTAPLLLFSPTPTVFLCIQCVAALYASLSALLAYIALFQLQLDARHKLALIIPPVLLMELYLLSILPVPR